MLASYAGVLYAASVIFFLVLMAEPLAGWEGARQLGWREIWRPLLSVGGLQSFGFGVIIAVALQAMLLWPIRRPAPGRLHTGRPIWQSVVVISAGVTLFALGPLIGFVQFAGNRDWINPESNLVEWALLAFLPVSWILWTGVLLMWLRAPSREHAIGRCLGLLFAGSIVEILVTIPSDLAVRRKTDCYCGDGTMFTLWIAGSLILWTMGPLALVLLLWRRRRPFYADHCPECGYAKGPVTQRPARCPECGRQWVTESRW